MAVDDHHGAGVVIGETATIGDHCAMHHVFIGTNAILLGPIRVGDRAKIGANAFVINHDVPPFSTVVGTPARIVKLNGEPTDQELPRIDASPVAVPVELEV
jgi:serine O-acetyltransferase